MATILIVILLLRCTYLEILGKTPVGLGLPRNGQRHPRHRKRLDSLPITHLQCVTNDSDTLLKPLQHRSTTQRKNCFLFVKQFPKTHFETQLEFSRDYLLRYPGHVSIEPPFLGFLEPARLVVIWTT